MRAQLGVLGSQRLVLRNTKAILKTVPLCLLPNRVSLLR
jgi:hypothetical protein